MPVVYHASRVVITRVPQLSGYNRGGAQIPEDWKASGEYPVSAVIVQNRSRSKIAVPDATGNSVTIEPGEYGVVRLDGARVDGPFWSLVARGVISTAPARRAA